MKGDELQTIVGDYTSFLDKILDKVKAEGLEHIEFVLFDDMQDFLQKYNGKPFELRAADRGINPEIGLQLGEYSVKFHLLNLPTVVYLEHKLGIETVQDTQS